MPSDVATPAASVPRDHQPSSTANNIVNGINDRANGKAPAAPPAPPSNGEQKPPVNPSAVDPNAGKEKYVVEGREVWLTPQERTTWIQKGMAFEPRMDQLARLAQEQQNLMRGLLSNPGAVLANVAKQNNVPMKDLVARVLQSNVSDEIKESVGQWYYENAVQPAQMTPEQLKAREDAKWRAERENADKAAQETAIRRQNHERFMAALGHLKAQISEAMKDSGLADNNTPLGAEMARQVADVMRLADKRKMAMTPKQAIELVKQHRIRAVQSSFYETIADRDEDGELLATELGDKIVAKIQKYLLKKAKSGGAGTPPPTVPQGKPAARGERKTISPDDMKEYLDNIKKTNKI